MESKISMKEYLNNKNGCIQEDIDCMEEYSFSNKCVVLEIESKNHFEKAMNNYLLRGYKVEASSCNSRCYKAILVL